MRIPFITLLLFFLCSAAAAQQADPHTKFTLNGQIKGYNDKYIYLSYRGYSKDRTWDSAKVVKGTFRFSGEINESYTNAFITTLTNDRIRDLESPDITPRLFLDPTEMTITLKLHDLQHARLTGSTSQTEFEELERSKSADRNALDGLNYRRYLLEQEFDHKRKAGSSPDSLSSIQQDISALRILAEPFQEKIRNIDRSFIIKHPSSYITVWLLNDYLSGFPVGELSGYYNNLPGPVQKCYYGQQVKAAILKLMKGAPGSTAPLFSSTEISGAPLSLADYRGRYVLLDFWASWCGPCRKGNPALVELYRKYHEKGIEFIGISSVTDKKPNWEKAIQTDGLSIWKHIQDTFNSANYNGELNEKYSIYSLPTKILVDPNGMVIGRYGDGGEAEDMMLVKFKALFEKH